MVRTFTALLLMASFRLMAQAPEVPFKMQFADLTLTLRDEARRHIQKDVNALVQSKKHHGIKVEKARSYFPLIEAIFREEGVPDDFKFLVLQESALVPNAVSTSNAVGYWQFKDYTAVEMGLRVDSEIDERMNIVASTRAAAKYFLKGYSLFGNWLYTLQSYQMGMGGVMQSVKDTQGGKKHIEITGKTYWYVLKFLAYKIAFEGEVEEKPAIALVKYAVRDKKNLEALAREVSVPKEELAPYNLWMKKGRVPNDRDYYAIIPVKNETQPWTNLPATTVQTETLKPEIKKPIVPTTAKATENRIKINGLPAIKALPDEKAKSMADRGGISLANFLKYNDISISDPIRPDVYYFLRKKRNKSETDYHKALPGEQLWEISQKYGVKLKRLLRLNRLEDDAVIAAGALVWLSMEKPVSPHQGNTATAKVEEGEEFSWGTDGPTPAPVLPTVELSQKKPLDVKDSAQIQGQEAVKMASLPVVLEDQRDAVVEKIAPVVEKTAPVAEDSIKIKTELSRPYLHTVQQGETLYSIAQKYNVEVMELVDWNKLNLNEKIYPGLSLRLLSSEFSPNTNKSKEILHQVKPSDTLYSIARKYGVTIQEIMEWNGKKDFNLTLGEKIKVFPR